MAGLGARRERGDGRARARGRRCRGCRRCGSPTTPPARCSTASRCAREPKALLDGAPASRWWSRATRISAAARPAPTTCCSRRSPASCGRRKVATLEERAPDVIAAGNIGCMMQIGAGTAVPVVHTAELLDWATGGPRPPALARLRLLRARRFSCACWRFAGGGRGAAPARRRGGGAVSRRRPAQHRREPLLHRDADRARGDRHRRALPLPSAHRRAGAARRVPLRRRAAARRGRGGAAAGAGGGASRLRLRRAGLRRASAPTWRCSSSTGRSRPRTRRPSRSVPPATAPLSIVSYRRGRAQAPSIEEPCGAGRGLRRDPGARLRDHLRRLRRAGAGARGRQAARRRGGLGDRAGAGRAGRRADRAARAADRRRFARRWPRPRASARTEPRTGAAGLKPRAAIPRFRLSGAGLPGRTQQVRARPGGRVRRSYRFQEDAPCVTLILPRSTVRPSASTGSRRSSTR